MKNATAEGEFNIEDGSIVVRKGAIIEKQISESFNTHNYLNLRKKLISQGKIEDFVLNEDYKFSSLSAAAAVIGGRSAAGPNQWNLEDGRTVKQYIELNDIHKKFVDFFNKNNKLKQNPKAYEEAKIMRELFPLDRIKRMALEEYDKKGSKSTFTYYLEYKTTNISGGWFGSSRNKLFFDQNGEYNNVDYIENKYPQLTLDERFSKFREDLVSLITEFDFNSYYDKQFQILPSQANYIKSKLINIHYPNKILCIDSKAIFTKILDYLGMKPNAYSDSVEMNIALLKFIYNLIPSAKNMLTWDIAAIIWKYYTEIVNIETLPDDVVESNEHKPDQIEDLFIDDVTIKEIVDLIKKKKNVILQGAPGVGKTFSIKKIINSKFNIYDAQEQILTVQFHQSFSYEEFIEGLRPTNSGNGFFIKSGVFKNFIEERVLINPDKDYFLIIDEINRGNLSKIFGELLMLIEADKRGEKHRVQLPYSGEYFYVPKNLYVIGTMNTADRSLALIDYALRRRFSFVDLIPKYNTDKFNQYLEKTGLKKDEIKLINQTMGLINKEVNFDLGSNFEIGHSYFVDKEVSDFETWYSNIMKYDIMPLLKEYYFDNPEKIEKFLVDLGLKNG